MITLLTDFGTADYFVPAMKGVILSLHPPAQILDLTHDIPAQDIRFAAFTLSACYRNFPAGTIHVAVVDPGVGSARHPLVIATEKYFFVGPDNGLFSDVFAHEKNARIFQATNTEFFRADISSTFHGRDIFAPLAAWLEKGVTPENFGTEISDVVRLNTPQPVCENEKIIAEIIHRDHFGNCVTNLTANELAPHEISTKTKIVIGENVVQQFGTHFAQATNPRELFAYLGSAGFWEIALWQNNAARKFVITRGTKIELLKF